MHLRYTGDPGRDYPTVGLTVDPGDVVDWGDVTPPDDGRWEPAEPDVAAKVAAPQPAPADPPTPAPTAAEQPAGDGEPHVIEHQDQNVTHEQDGQS